MQCYPEEENSKNLPDLENAGELIDLRNEQDRFRNQIHIKFVFIKFMIVRFDSYYLISLKI